MTLKKFTLILLLVAFATTKIFAQANPSIAVAPSNTGVVSVGATNDFTLTIGNTGTASIALSKLRPIVTIPASVTFLANILQTGLPAGWTILSNTGSQLRLCNSGFVVPPTSSTDIILKVSGVTIFAAQTFTGQINFGNGTTCAAGPTVAGNNTADDFATSTIEVVAAPACAITVTSSAGTIACNAGTTTLTATATGTANPVEYSLNGAAFQALNTFTVNAAGSPYTITAREVATPTCTATATAVTVTEPTAVTAAGVVSSAIVTTGGTGAVSVTGSGGTGTITYTITSGTTTNTTGAATGIFTGLLAGTYVITAADANGCTGVSNSVVLADGAACTIAVSAAAGTINCNGGTTTLTATATGATGAVEYSLNGAAFQAGNTFTVNAAGSPYTVTAREVSRTTCTATATAVTVMQPTTVTAAAAVSNAIVFEGGTGAVTATGSGGTGTITYVITSGTTINTTGAATGIFTGLLAGSYVITAADANGCTGVSNSVVLADGAACTIAVSAAAGTIACNGGTTTLTATATGAPGAVEYSLNGAAFQALNTFTVNAAGSPYTVIAREVARTTCTATATAVTVTQPTTVTAAAAVTNAIVFAGGTGAITATGSGGTGTITYVITSGTTINTTGAATGIFTGLLAGSYIITAADANGCTGVSNSVVLADGAACTIAVSAAAGTIACNAGTTTLTATATNAVGAVEYSLNGAAFQALNTFTVNAAGSPYTVTAREVARTTCTVTATAVTVTQPTAVTSSAAVTTPVTTTGGTGTITAVANGGTGAFTYVITSGTTINTTGASSGIFTGLLSGNYTFTATDVNACASPATSPVFLSDFPALPVTLSGFNAVLVNCQPSLKWATEGELNSEKFEIERSNQKAVNWRKIGEVAAQGTSTIKTKYNFTDNNITSEKVLYRLKIIDKDGRYKYSQALPVTVNCKTMQLTVFPNPVQIGQLYVSLTGTKGNTQARLLSSTGQEIFKANINNGTNSFNVSKIASGAYVLSVEDTNGFSKKIKVLIQN